MNAVMEAQIRVTGETSLLAPFRERVRQLLVRDPLAEAFEDALNGDVLEYRFVLERGIPFPVFAEVSAEFPELRVEADWTNHQQSLSGRAVIERGKLVEQSTEPLAQDTGVSWQLQAAGEGRLGLALVCARQGDDWAGYAVSADEHGYFRFADGRLEVFAPEAPQVDAALESLALDFAAEWLWYDESPLEETAVERELFAARGWAVCGANLRTARVARLPERRVAPGTDAPLEAMAAALAALWKIRLESTK